MARVIRAQRLFADLATVKAELAIYQQIYGVGVYLGLVRNGGGITRDNSNFSAGVFRGDMMVSGGGAFALRDGQRVMTTDDMIAIDPNKQHELTFYACNLSGSGEGFFSALATYDMDGRVINAADWMFVANSTTRLTQPLKTGDRIAHVESTANWTPTSGNEARKGLTAWGYRSDSGFTYPRESYSRYGLLQSGLRYTALTETTVEFSGAWPHPEQPVGTYVSNGATGGTYIYIGALGSKLEAEWQAFRGIIGGDSGNLLPAGTAYVRPMFLTTSGSPFAINMVSVRQL